MPGEQVGTAGLRPHDHVVSAPDGGFERGAEVRLVTDPAGHPFPAEGSSSILRIFDAAGHDATCAAGSLWEVVRGSLDDCRACFLFRSSRMLIAS